MNRSLLLLYLCLSFPIAITTAVSENVVSPDSIPNRETPKELVEAWLRFHETDLCQGSDARFIFTKNGMIVRILVEDEKSYQKLEELLLPFRSSYGIELDATRPPEETKTEEEKREEREEPPASLWENYQLRSFLGDPIVRVRERPGFDDNSESAMPSSDPVIKQRLLLFADRTLAWNRKIERYAKDLPALTRVSLDSTLLPGIRSQAAAACLAHTQNLDKYIVKQIKNLEPAFPSSKKKESSGKPDKSAVPDTPVDRADRLSELAAGTARRVHEFIYPEHYSVGLDELRQPALLESLKSLRKANSDFQSSLSKVKK